MKILNKILHFLILIVALIIQITFFEHLKLFYISFDLVMVILVAITLIDGAFYGIIFGFIVGLVLNLMVGNLVGISALVYALDAFIVWRLVEVGFRNRLISQIFLVFVVTETNLITASLVRYLFNFQVSLSGLGLELILAPVFNMILITIIYPAVRISLNRGLEEFEFKYKSKT